MEEAGSGRLSDHGRQERSPLGRLRDAIERIAEVTRGRPATGLTLLDADEDVGTLATDDAVGFDPFPVLRALHVNEANVVVIGQVAGIMHGSTELTGDLDLLWTGGDEELPAVLAALREVQAKLSDEAGPRRPPPKMTMDSRFATSHCPRCWPCADLWPGRRTGGAFSNWKTASPASDARCTKRRSRQSVERWRRSG